MPNKYHEALSLAMSAISNEISDYRREWPENEWKEKTINHKQECIIRLSELQNILLKIAQLKQSLKELDLEESK